MPSVAAMEEDLGIELFSTSSEGIGGAIKQREEDFRVEEIPLWTDMGEDASGVQNNGPYSVFWLEKRGLDTLLAIKRIAKSLGISQKRLSFAGMKDRNAITLQRVSAWKVPAEKLRQVNLSGIQIKDVSQSDVPIRMGSHWGNAFSIIVRGIPFTVTEAETRIEMVSEEIRSKGGLLNYFGQQRFGLSRPITHIVGLRLLKGDLRDAAMVFLSKTSPYESDDVRGARAELAATEDFELAVKRFPVRLSYELAMLNKLASDPRNFANAFRALPRRLLQMFISAAQSWLFNKFLSERLRRNIQLNECVPGDVASPLDARGLTTNEFFRVEDSNPVELKEQLDSGKAAIVYPVPGFDMNLPEGVMKEIVREIMDREGIVPRSFWISMIPETSSAGVFRSIVLIPKGLKITASCSETAGVSNARFEFSLVRGGYATVVLREFMKNDNPLAAGY
ncbi:MAG: tRNA pseudouridine(13) synthase TruD [Promethearchaeati archaeon SRVP18_Atabeyarchaeia-1]